MTELRCSYLSDGQNALHHLAAAPHRQHSEVTAQEPEPQEEEKINWQMRQGLQQNLMAQVCVPELELRQDLQLLLPTEGREQQQEAAPMNLNKQADAVDEFVLLKASRDVLQVHQQEGCAWRPRPAQSVFNQTSFSVCSVCSSV